MEIYFVYFLSLAGLYSRLGATRFIRPPTSRSTGGTHHWSWGSNRQATGLPNPNAVKMRGRHLLDHEALTCLLVLLFVEEPKLNTTRLHRVLRNLCYHGPTRTWVIRALLAMLKKTSVESDGDASEVATPMSTAEPNCVIVNKGKSGGGEESSRKSSNSTVMNVCRDDEADTSISARLEARTVSQPTWLSISLDAALGCRANVFQISRNMPSPTSGAGMSSKKQSSVVSTSNVGIHPQASPLVCRHVLDTLISLAKSFPSQFLPQSKAKEANCASKDGGDVNEDKENKLVTIPESQEGSASKSGKPATSLSQTPSQSSPSPEMDFWEILVRLDNTSSGVRKGKAFQRSHAAHGSAMPTTDSPPSTFEESALGQLMTMLAHPVVKRSQQLTDRLLRLLGLVSISLPDISQAASTVASATTVATTAPVTTLANATATPAVTSAISTVMAVTPAAAVNIPTVSSITPIVPATTPVTTGLCLSIFLQSSIKPCDVFTSSAIYIYITNLQLFHIYVMQLHNPNG